MQLNGTYTLECLDAVMNGIEEGILIVSRAFEIQSVNVAGEVLLGRSKSEILNTRIELLFEDESGKKIDFSEFLEVKKMQCFLKNKITAPILFEIRVSPVLVNSLTDAYVVFLKVIQEKFDVKEIKESERKYKGLFENALEGILVLDSGSNIIDANPAACEIYGLNREEILKLQAKDMFPHQTAEESNKIWDNFMKTGFLNGFYKYKLSKGGEKYIDFKVKANFIKGLHLAVFSDVTDKTLTGKALRNSEANLQAIFNNTNHQFILLDKEYKILAFNAGAQKNAIETLAMELKVGDSVMNYGSEEGNKRFAPIYERAKQGETILLEVNPTSSIKPDHWIEMGVIPVFDSKKSLTGILLSVNDITDRKKAELDIFKSEARFRSLVQNSSDIITILDKENKIVYSSSSVENILGYKEEALNGKSIFDFIHIDDKAPVRSKFKKIISERKFNPIIEYRFLHQDGDYLYLETTCSNLLENEHVKGIVLNSRDITERKNQEENLLLLERAIDSSSNGILISDPNQPDNPIIYSNKAFEQITGYSYLDFIGKNCRYLQQEDRDQPELERIRTAIENQKEVSVVLRNYKKDGTLFWNQLSISPVFNRNGDLSNYIGVINDISERKIAEDALLEITQGISGANKDGIYVSLVKHIGISLKVEFAFVGELIGDRVKTKGFWQDGKVIENVEYDKIHSPCNEVIGKGISCQFVDVAEKFPLDKLLSNEKIFSYLGVPLKDSSGKTIGIIGVMSREAFYNLPLIESILNIFSVRASAELERDFYIAALRGSEKKFKDLSKNSPDLIYIIDLESDKVIYFNKSEILGYTSQELSRSEDWAKIIYRDDLERLNESWEKLLKSSHHLTRSIEYRIKNKKGDYEWVANRHIILERSPEGKPKQVLLNLTVITERKKSEEALRESEARLTALIENTNDIMWSVDTNMCFTTMNSAFRNLFKIHYKKEIKIGDRLRDVLPDHLKEEWIELHERTLKGESFSVEFMTPEKLNIFSYEVSYHPIYSDNRSISGVSVFARDITQRKAAENDIMRTNFELDSFVYRASHDLRAPLRSVLGLVNLAKTEYDETERNTYLKLVEKSVNKLDTFISDLTNFSRNGRLEIGNNKIDFSSIIGECFENLKYMDNADRINSQITINMESDFYSDFTRMNIILHNIISNSIKYQNLRIQDSFVKVYIHATSAMVEIIISDNGKGIKEEYLDRIFNMFFRASQESYGSGLGLYITRQVVEKLSGSISVTSKFGLGTEFKVKLPNLKA